MHYERLGQCQRWRGGSAVSFNSKKWRQTVAVEVAGLVDPLHLEVEHVVVVVSSGLGNR